MVIPLLVKLLIVVDSVIWLFLKRQGMVMSLPTRFRLCARVWANKPKPQCDRNALVPGS
jgi:hypothetical protein